ncbi:glutamate--ammonia ligase [Mucor velutinosus]|uniref:Glutamate--ammonia ligase n=1 Tax=Mucor velutinosus TaxID=708070 RepID=A0AAN7DKQ2_9FUNG|nr:glutamate--ammonia ligase [Mucor velutinosus]
MSNNNNLGLYLIASPVVLVVSCLVMVLPVNAIMQWKHMLHDEVDFSINMSNMASYMQMIPSSWLFIIASLCTYKAAIKYQLTFKKLYYNIHQAYSGLEFNFTGATNNKMPGSFASLAQPATAATAITTTITSTTSTRKQHHKKTSRSCHHQKPRKRTLEAKPVSTTVPQITRTKIKALDRTPEASACESEWVVYESKKAKRSSLPTLSKTATLPASPKQRRYSLEAPLSAANDSCATDTCDQDQINATNLEKRKRLQIKSLLPLRRPLDCHEEEDTCDIPHLSDNDTDSQASVESPRLRSRDLPCVQQQPSYYSPFSTGFDFGVPSILLESKDETKFYPGRLNEYLAPQAPHSRIPSVENISSYTPPAINSKAYNLLKLLNPSNDQIETTITPAAFKYFDEMLISNSLCKYQKEDEVFLKNKRQWNSFAR